VLRIYNKAILDGITNQTSVDMITRKIYLSYPTAVFKDKEDIEFEILNKIANYFRIPFMSVQVVGSAKTGYSYVKRTDFKKGESDLDIAIISHELFTCFLDYTCERTKGYDDFTVCNPGDFNSLKENFTRGYINPTILPRGKLKDDWLYFFRNLSREYIDFFKSINGGVYATQYLFEMKQYKAIKAYLVDFKS
jgi:hypothetical protein